MSIETFERTVDSPASAHETFEWHVRPGALRRLLPPWDSATVVSGSGPTERLEAGARTTIRVGLGPVGIHWVAEIAKLDQDATYFVDKQITGPFKSWDHRHQVEARGERSALTDHIEYALPMGILGRTFGGGAVRKKLNRMFAWRHRVMLHDLEAHGRASAAGFAGKRIAITGASGLVGRSLAAFLRTGGHEVIELVRRAPKGAHEVRWDPAAGTVDHGALEGIDALVHLAGESIFGLRWTSEKKRRIVESRVHGTRAIVSAINAMKAPPKVLVCASAIGFYGGRGEEVLTEDSAQGTGFLAETCAAWENEVGALRKDVREVRGRIGVVLDAGGGALKTMLPAFQLGGGGRLGSGSQWFPWIALDDLIGAFHRAMYDDSLAGPLNFVSPGEVRGKEFAKCLGRVLWRPTILPAPRFALHAVLGKEQAEEMLLASVRVRPEGLQEAGFPYRYPDLEDALKHALGRAV